MCTCQSCGSILLPSDKCQPPYILYTIGISFPNAITAHSVAGIITFGKLCIGFPIPARTRAYMFILPRLVPVNGGIVFVSNAMMSIFRDKSFRSPLQMRRKRHRLTLIHVRILILMVLFLLYLSAPLFSFTYCWYVGLISPIGVLMGSQKNPGMACRSRARNAPVFYSSLC